MRGVHGDLMFRNSLAFVRWTLWAHAGTDTAILVGVAALLVAFGSRRPPQTKGTTSPVRSVPHILAVASMVAAIASVVVAARPPALTVSRRALTRFVVQDLTKVSGLSSGTVAAPSWARIATASLLRHYAAYTQGHFRPRLPSRYRLLLLIVRPETVLQVTPTFQTPGLSSLATQTVATVLAGMPENTIVSLARARRVAVGLATGLEITNFQRTDRLFLALYARGPK